MKITGKVMETRALSHEPGVYLLSVNDGEEMRQLYVAPSTVCERVIEENTSYDFYTVEESGARYAFAVEENRRFDIAEFSERPKLPFEPGGLPDEDMLDNLLHKIDYKIFLLEVCEKTKGEKLAIIDRVGGVVKRIDTSDKKNCTILLETEHGEQLCAFDGTSPASTVNLSSLPDIGSEIELFGAYTPDAFYIHRIEK